MSIPIHVSASRAIARSEQYAGDLADGQLQRLKEFAPLALRASLNVGPADVGRGRIEGRIDGVLQLECQACMAPYEWKAEVTIDLVIATTEEEESSLMRGHEALLVLDDEIRLRELVEDEVLLAVPLLRRCGACENQVPESSGPEPEQSAESKPLAALKQLKLKS